MYVSYCSFFVVNGAAHLPPCVSLLTAHKPASALPPVCQDTSHEMVVASCRFLCYFCRTSRQNQKAMFDHLQFLLENSNILLSRPSLRGSTPLDVSYSSLMDNTELALALRSVERRVVPRFVDHLFYMTGTRNHDLVIIITESLAVGYDL